MKRTLERPIRLLLILLALVLGFVLGHAILAALG